MTEYARQHRAAAIVRAAGAPDLETVRRETWATAWGLAWQQAVEWAAGAAYDAAVRELEEELENAFSAGRDTGMLESRADTDAIWRLGYEDSLRDQRAVVEKLKARIAALEAAA